MVSGLEHPSIDMSARRSCCWVNDPMNEHDPNSQGITIKRQGGAGSWANLVDFTRLTWVYGDEITYIYSHMGKFHKVLTRG